MICAYGSTLEAPSVIKNYVYYSLFQITSHCILKLGNLYILGILFFFFILKTFLRTTIFDTSQVQIIERSVFLWKWGVETNFYIYNRKKLCKEENLWGTYLTFYQPAAPL